MVYRELNRLDVNIIAHHIGCQNMALRVIDKTTRRVQRKTLDMLFIRTLCKARGAYNLPVVQPAQKNNHSGANKHENEHLTAASAAQFYTHFILLSRLSRLH